MANEPLSNIVERLEKATARLEAISGVPTSMSTQNTSCAKPQSAASAAGNSASIQGYDDLIAQRLRPFVALSDQLGGEIAKQVRSFDFFRCFQRADPTMLIH